MLRRQLASRQLNKIDRYSFKQWAEYLLHRVERAAVRMLQLDTVIIYQLMCMQAQALSASQVVQKLH